MDRAPGLSVRLKLTLSYAGFLMLAGVLLLAAVWVFLLRYVPDRLLTRSTIGGVFPIRSNLLHVFAPRAAAVLVILLLFGLLGGWLLAGRMLAPLTRITAATRTATTGSLSHRIGLPGRTDEFRELADAFDTMLARLEAQSAEQQRFAANASHELRTPLAITQTLLEVARNDPNHDTGELVDRLHAVNTRAIDLTEALLLLSRADRPSFTPVRVDLSLLAEEATEALLPFAEGQGVTIETSGDMTPTIGSETLLLQLITNLVHNAIVHNLPAQGTVWVTTSAHPKTVVLTVENTGEKLTPPVVATLVEPFRARHRTQTLRPRWRRPRPGDRQKHHPSPRRNPHPHPSGRRRSRRHRATTRRATRQWGMTIWGIAPRPVLAAARRTLAIKSQTVRSDPPWSTCRDRVLALVNWHVRRPRRHHVLPVRPIGSGIGEPVSAAWEWRSRRPSGAILGRPCPSEREKASDEPRGERPVAGRCGHPSDARRQPCRRRAGHPRPSPYRRCRLPGHLRVWCGSPPVVSLRC